MYYILHVYDFNDDDNNNYGLKKKLISFNSVLRMTKSYVKKLKISNLSVIHVRNSAWRITWHGTSSDGSIYVHLLLS
jgi:hypothetical protein